MSDAPRLASIWAQDCSGIIGSGTAMLWRVPADLKFFQSMTKGSPVIMGRASWEALGTALPGRDNIVITGQADYQIEGALVVHSIDQAIRCAREVVSGRESTTIWITGGARVYAETIDLVDELVVTQLDLAIDPRTSPVVRAPAIDPTVWQVDPARSDSDWRAKSGDARWKVSTYVRINPA